MTVDWDGRIRMDPSSPYAMARLIGMKDRFDLSFACDTDHDRHGIVTKSRGLLPPNHDLSAAVHNLFQHRPRWRKEAAVGKTVVSSTMIDRVAAKSGAESSSRCPWASNGSWTACSTDPSCSRARRAQDQRSTGSTEASGQPTRTDSCAVPPERGDDRPYRHRPRETPTRRARRRIRGDLLRED